MEQQERANDVIITGIKVKHRSYARAVQSREGEGEDDLDRNSTEEQVVASLKNYGVQLNEANISTCYTISRRGSSDKVIVLKFLSRKFKTELLKQGRKLKGSNIYLNEHLTKSNATISRRARELRKAGKITNTWTNDCRIFIKLNGPEEKIVNVKNIQELDIYNL